MLLYRRLPRTGYGRVYALCVGDTVYYVGITVQSLEERLKCHISTAKRCMAVDYVPHSAPLPLHEWLVLALDDITMQLLWYGPSIWLRTVEHYFITAYDSSYLLNVMGRTDADTNVSI